MRGVVFACVAAIAALLGAVPASARSDVQIEIDINSQSMDVYVEGRHYAEWRVSTGRDGYETPSGSFRAQRLEEEWYSKEYDDAPMPHAIFFSGGYAIHGTYETRRLGRPASHGCVRLSPRNAANLFAIVSDYGINNTRITISD